MTIVNIEWTEKALSDGTINKEWVDKRFESRLKAIKEGILSLALDITDVAVCLDRVEELREAIKIGKETLVERRKLKGNES